jgi:hypothetical protein
MLKCPKTHLSIRTLGHSFVIRGSKCSPQVHSNFVIFPRSSSNLACKDDTDEDGVEPDRMNWKAGIIVMSTGISASGCLSPDPPSINSDSPPRAIPAIKQAAQNDDRSAIPRLVHDLNDSDSAIRFAAIEALAKMTGQTLDYRYYDDESVRRPAVQRWREWLKMHPVQ